MSLKLHRHVVLAALSGVVLSSAACTDPEHHSDGAPEMDPRCDPDSRDLRWDVEGLPDAGSEPVWEDRGIMLAPIPGRGLDFHKWMPWDMNDRQAYYLRPADDGFHIRLPFVVGQDWPNLRGIEMQVALNARLTTFVANGVETRRAIVSVSTDRRGELKIFIPREQFRVGLNHLHFIPTVDAGERDAPETPSIFALGGWTIAVARDADEPMPEWTDSGGGRDVTFDPSVLYNSFSYRSRDGRDRYLTMVPGRPQVDGTTLRGTLRLMRDPDTVPCSPSVNDTFAVIGVLDGEQIALSDDGPIIATLAPGQYREVDVQIELPTAAGRHRLSIYMLPSLNAPVYLAGRRRAGPWPVGPRVITDFTWEESGDR